MRLSLIGASTYQIFGLLDFLYNIPNYQEVKVDFYLVDGFFNCEKIFLGLKECGAFSNVYLIKKGEARTFKHYYDLCYELLVSTKCMLKCITHDKCNNFNYDMIICENYFPVATYLRIVNPDAKFYIIEDGVAPYYYPMHSYIYKTYSKRNKVYNILNKKYVEFRVDGIFCYDAKFASEVQGDSIDCLKLQSLSQCSNVFWETVLKIFPLSSKEQYTNNRIIAIDSHGADEESSSFEEFLLPYSKYVIVRPHPREVSREYILPSVDRVLDAWELICADCIHENHIIVGSYSTAQFVPKLLYNKEPWIIFTWSMNKNLCKSNENSDVIKHILHLKNAYNDKDKVILIDNGDQLHITIDSILESQ